MPPASTRFGSCGVAVVYSTRSQQRHSSIHSCRLSSRVDYCNALLAGAPKVTTDKLQRVMNFAARVRSLAHTSSTEAYPGYCILNCTGSMCPSEGRTSSASWCTVACKVKRRSTWSMSAYQSPTLLLGSISSPPVDDSWFFRVTGCERTADGLSLLLARRPGTHCLTV